MRPGSWAEEQAVRVLTAALGHDRDRVAERLRAMRPPDLVSLAEAASVVRAAARSELGTRRPR